MPVETLLCSSQLMKLHLSKAMFHDGNEYDCTQVIRHGKRILQEDQQHVDALSMMALANVYLGREEEAWKYLSRTESNSEQTVMLNWRWGVF